jgi:hypothetical protein
MRWRVVRSGDRMRIMVGTHNGKSQRAIPGVLGNHLKLWALMDSYRLHSNLHSVRMRPRIDCHITINQVGRMSPSYSRMVSPGPAYYRRGGLGS